MHVTPRSDVYSPREIALAAGVPVDRVVALVGGSSHIPYREALRIGRRLAGLAEMTPLAGVDRPLFSIFSPAPRQWLSNRVSLALSGSLHVGLIAGAVFLTIFATTPAATTLADVRDADRLHLVFLVVPGPGGGGGGGGLLGESSPPEALQEGRHTVDSPLPRPPAPLEPIKVPPEPQPTPLNSEPLPIVVAPIVASPADSATRVGVLAQAATESESRGQGRGGGVGSGSGTGIGQGDGSGLGAGAGGGTGGGAYRPGSGIERPRLIREIKADYSEDARRRGITGEVILEIVVRRDGSVGDVKVVRGLGWGLDERAVQAVSQWGFAPAQRQGTPVDVIVEVAVEFKFR